MKSVRFSWLVISALTVYTVSAEAQPRRRKASVPLMPVESAQAPSEGSLGAWRFGVGLGALMRSQQTNSDLLGLDAALGLRGVAWIPLAERWSISPSVGGFWRSEGSGALNVAEYRFEFGASVLYQVVKQPDWNLHLGVAQRADVFFSRIGAWDAARSSSLGFLYRVGPDFQFDVRIAPSTHLWGQIETTLSLEQPLRVWPGAMFGVQFEMGN